MKTTGIVRRIDDLGRIVIPKPVREKFNIKTGDPLEIYIDEANNAVAFKKYRQDEPEVRLYNAACEMRDALLEMENRPQDKNLLCAFCNYILDNFEETE